MFQDVGVLGVQVDAGQVVVDVYGSSSNTCGTVRFLISDPVDQTSTVARLERWARLNSPLTLVAHGPRVSLQHSHALTSQLRPRPQ
jgi:hypothetical protein